MIKSILEKSKRIIRKVLNKSVILFIVLMALIIFLGSGFFTNDKVNASGVSTKSNKEVVRIVVKDGDTLWSIANFYDKTGNHTDIREYIKEIKKCNSIKSDRIVTGDYLIIPYYN